MASNTRWISYNHVKEHPEESLLLAYLRGQELEIRASVIQHIDREKCPVCLQKLNELKQVSTTLDVLGEMRSYQYYPELSVAGTFVRMQSAVTPQIPVKTGMNDANYRQLSRKSAVRLISVPVAFGLTIEFTMAMLVFVNLSGKSFNPFSAARGTSPGQNIATVVVPPHSTLTSETSSAKEPHMKICSKETDIDQLRLVICGSNFDSTHKATLVVYLPYKKHLWLRVVHVDYPAPG